MEESWNPSKSKNCHCGCHAPGSQMKHCVPCCHPEEDSLGPVDLNNEKPDIFTIPKHSPLHSGNDSICIICGRTHGCHDSNHTLDEKKLEVNSLLWRLNKLDSYIRAAYRQEFEEDDQSPIEDLMRHAFITLAERSKEIRKLRKQEIFQREAKETRMSEYAIIAREEAIKVVKAVEAESKIWQARIAELEKELVNRNDEISSLRCHLSQNGVSGLEALRFEASVNVSKELEKERDQLKAHVAELVKTIQSTQRIA